MTVFKDTPAVRTTDRLINKTNKFSRPSPEKIKKKTQQSKIKGRVQ